jgi:RNA-directed DNA polymerase
VRQMTMQMVLPLEDRGEAPNVRWSGEADPAAQGNERSGSDCLMEQVVERGNCLAAFKRVRKNKGSPGIDGMRVDDLPEYLRKNWEQSNRSGRLQELGRRSA